MERDVRIEDGDGEAALRSLKEFEFLPRARSWQVHGLMTHSLCCEDTVMSYVCPVDAGERRHPVVCIEESGTPF